MHPRKALLAPAAALVLIAAAASPGLASTAVGGGASVAVSHADPVAHGLVTPRGAVRTRGTFRAAAGRTPNMTYHGGKVMTAANIHPIFWGTSWTSPTDEKIVGIDTFYAGWNGSHYALTNTEYTGVGGVHVGAGSTAAGSVRDTSPATGGNQTAPILAEVAKLVATNVVPLDTTGNGYYPVYTDVPRGTAGFCAWHSAGTVNGQPVQFAFFFRLDGDPGCDPADPSTAHSQGLEAIANVSAHELSEALTDPASPGAWFDRLGEENGDKCAWLFTGGSVTLANNSVWRLQAEWSNAAFTAGTGFPNSAGQRGCIFSR